MSPRPRSCPREAWRRLIVPKAFQMVKVHRLVSLPSLPSQVSTQKRGASLLCPCCLVQFGHLSSSFLQPTTLVSQTPLLRWPSHLISVPASHYVLSSLLCWNCLRILGESPGHYPGTEGPFCITALSVPNFSFLPACLGSLF